METVAVMMVMKKPSKSLSPEWRSGSCSPQKWRSRWWRCSGPRKILPPMNRVFPVYKGVRRKRGGTSHRGPSGPKWRSPLVGPHHLVAFAGQVAPGLCLRLRMLLFHKNFHGIFPQIYFRHFLHQKDKKVFFFAKNNVRFCRFIS
jgi:hypothetical protein